VFINNHKYKLIPIPGYLLGQIMATHPTLSGKQIDSHNTKEIQSPRCKTRKVNTRTDQDPTQAPHFLPEISKHSKLC
jgi:hypothetical protein